MRKIKSFEDGTYLAYDEGNFDNWCVYLVDLDGQKIAPLDIDYLQMLFELAIDYGNNKVYDDFINVYHSTTPNISEKVLLEITECSRSYGIHKAMKVDKLFTTLYMAMVSEENYPNTRLGKRIKHLAVYEMLYGGRTVEDAANFMRGMQWRDIARLCEERGF